MTIFLEICNENNLTSYTKLVDILLCYDYPKLNTENGLICKVHYNDSIVKDKCIKNFHYDISDP